MNKDEMIEQLIEILNKLEESGNDIVTVTLWSDDYLRIIKSLIYLLVNQK